MNMPSRPALRVLIVEDRIDDARLAVVELCRQGWQPIVARVATRAACLRALLGFRPEVILVDGVMPTFDARSALRLARKYAPGVPAIAVTGVLVPEIAATFIREGARDCVLKDQLRRLGPAVRRVLAEQRRIGAPRAAACA